MKAVAYLRVSTQDQSLQRQYDDIEKFAIDKNLDLIKIFEDKVSGSKTKTDNRIGFNQMEKFIELNQEVKHILVLEISRLGRKNSDIQNVVERYSSKGINIHIKDLGESTLDKNGNRDFKSDLIISMLGVMAANESRLLSSRIKSGKMSNAKKNLAFGGNIIGYKKGEDGTPVIDEEQAPMIKRIFELASKGQGMRNISAIIESEYNRKIAIGTLSGIVRNTFHKGERKYNNLTLPVPPIVTENLWQKANNSIDSRSKFGSRTKVNTNIVQGKISCGECDNTMHQKVIPQGRIDIFICKDTRCKNSINRPWLFRMVRLAVEKHAKKTKEKQYRDEIELKILSNEALIKANNKEQEKLKRRRIRLQTIILDDEMSDEQYNNHIAIIKDGLNKVKINNDKLNEEIKGFKTALENEIKHFDKDLEVFKIQIKDILKSIVIYRNRVLIDVFGWHIYDLHKPNSTKLGWEARKPESERYINEKLPLRHPINDENLKMMISNELYFDENEIDKHNNSN
ncbi:recombinase family protein [Flavobacteriaceae bacterium S0825]|uniref:recombinase family protein n=1 Tax=Gaetbulibacter sp. S0825 TaxID=2720084 RepID=UPI00142FFB53|nr:recombinase family protein [Gaetbulibacter sp. S0825]MCK0109548.1 recombinase family protein [Flavobacteriaceae bacterium S0825]NIX65181.1 recombinase family protein [Gaetbulibacter sp. S0825]